MRLRGHARARHCVKRQHARMRIQGYLLCIEHDIDFNEAIVRDAQKFVLQILSHVMHSCGEKRGHLDYGFAPGERSFTCSVRINGIYFSISLDMCGLLMCDLFEFKPTSQSLKAAE